MTSFFSRRRSFFSRFGATYGASARWPRPGGPELLDQVEQGAAVRLRHLVYEALEQRDLDVGVASLAERVGQRLDLFSALRWRLGGKQGSNISSAARRRRVATRMSCTRSTSSRSRTPSEWAKTSLDRTLTTLPAACENDPSQSSSTLRAPATP